MKVGADAIFVRTVDGQKVHQGKFLVESNIPGSIQKFDWMVMAVRADVAPLNVEPLKSESEVYGVGPYAYITRKGLGHKGELENSISRKEKQLEEMKQALCAIKPSLELCRN